MLQSAAKNFSASIASFWDSYQRTEKKVKIVDLFLVYAMATALVQFTYCLLVGNFPFNSFLSGFGCALGVFILGGTVQRWARGCGCRHSIFVACPPALAVCLLRSRLGPARVRNRATSALSVPRRGWCCARRRDFAQRCRGQHRLCVRPVGLAATAGSSGAPLDRAA